MGWFDDNDSDDDEEKHEQQQTVANTDANVNTSTKKVLENKINDDDDDDPLDVYMKALDDVAPSKSKSRAERLDVENAEEATSHWKEPTSTQQVVTIDDTQSKRASEEALASGFHKAGDTQRQHQVELTLEQVHHDSIPYEPFQREFLRPKDTPAGHNWRKEQQVTCTPGRIDPILEFNDIAHVLGPELVQMIQSKGYQKPTAVQSQTLAVAFAGHDCLVTASTGSGKTLAYIWPMVVHCCDQRELNAGEGPIGLVLVPTRELAMQVQKQAQMMIHALKGTSIAITGGVGRYQLVQDFSKRGCELVVATPGRFLDVLSIKKNGISLRRVSMVVLDEADKMLDMGFETQVTEILKNVRPDRQSLLLSATMGRKVEQVINKWLKTPVRISVGRTGEASEHVTQHVMVLPSYNAKREWLVEMLPVLANVGRTIVFVATRVDCESVADVVRERNTTLIVETLHGDKHPSDRHAALKAFANGKVLILIATDVASRGLDISNVSTVVNFDAAKNLDVHTHRVGRAGRLAKDSQEHREGTAYTLLTNKNSDFAHVLMNAFEREGRDVTSELKELAEKSRRSGHVDSRAQWNKAGIGFSDIGQPSLSANHYGSSSSQKDMPSAKKSRMS